MTCMRGAGFRAWVKRQPPTCGGGGSRSARVFHPPANEPHRLRPPHSRSLGESLKSATPCHQGAWPIFVPGGTKIGRGRGTGFLRGIGPSSPGLERGSDGQPLRLRLLGTVAPRRFGALGFSSRRWLRFHTVCSGRRNAGTAVISETRSSSRGRLLRERRAPGAQGARHLCRFSGQRRRGGGRAATFGR